VAHEARAAPARGDAPGERPEGRIAAGATLWDNHADMIAALGTIEKRRDERP